MPLPRSFYERDAAIVARDLLGNFLIRRTKAGAISGRIVETEAYYGSEDPASRAYKATPMSKPMFGTPGKTFIYMVHGNWLLNIVTGKKGTASAVLIRALEPLPSMEKIFKGKGKRIASGPGRLTKAMNITKAQQGIDVTYPKSELIIVEGKKEFSIASSHRIGVREDLPQKLRFYIKDNEFVSK